MPEDDRVLHAGWGPGACDADVFLPARARDEAAGRADAREGLERGFVRAEEENRQHAEIAHLARELFSRSPRAYAGAPKRVRLMACADPNAEAMAVGQPVLGELARAKRAGAIGKCGL